MAADEKARRDLEDGSDFSLEIVKEQVKRRFAVDSLGRNWWAVLLRGAAAIVFGHITVIAPVTSLAELGPIFGAYACADAILALVSALRWGAAAWWPFVLISIVGMGTGLSAIVQPAVIENISLIELIAPWALVTGALQIVAAFRIRRVIGREWLLACSGAVSIGLAALLALFPNARELAVILGLGVYSVVFGMLLTALGLRLRSRRQAMAVKRAAAPKQAWADL